MLKASSRPDAILFLPSTVCSSHVTTCNPNFQQLAKDKKLNPNQWEVRLIEFKFCEDTRPDPQLQKAKAQHSVLIANLNRQGNSYTWPLLKLWGLSTKTIQTNLWQTLIWITIRLKPDTQTEWALHQTCICTHKNKVCTVGHIIIRDNTLSLLKLCCPHLPLFRNRTVKWLK